MPRGRKPKNQSVVQPIDNLNDYVEAFATNLYKTLDKLYKNPYYSPIYANNLMKDVNLSPKKPTMDKLRGWLQDPEHHEKDLRGLSQYLSNCIMQYERIIFHFATLPSFNYYLYPIGAVPKDGESKKTYLNCKSKAMKWLQKFRPKEQLVNVMIKILRDGGSYYYVRESDGFIDLQEMPADYSMIDGRTSLGYTYAFNMAFFLRLPEALKEYAPEFEEWYGDFYDEYEQSGNMTYYKRMPPEKSVVFKLDDTTASMTPPLQGVFKDALLIEDYKNLQRAKAELDTYELIFQEVPKDKDGKPTVDPILASQFVAMVQATLPEGVKTCASPLAPTPMKFTESQTQNNIAGMGTKNFWESAGVSSYEFGTDSSSVASIQYSNMSDANYICSNVYPQIQRFINYQLSLVTGEYKFAIKMFGDKFSKADDIEKFYQAATVGIAKKAYVASLEIEPFMFENMLDDEDLEGYNDKIKPLMTSFTQTDNGRPEKDAKDMTNNSSIATKDKGYNDGKPK